MARYVPSVSAKESPAALLAWANENDIVEIDMRFVDIRGVPQHFSMPIQSVDEGSFEDGFGFDGSSIQGFQAIHESDMILLADLSTAYVDPFLQLQHAGNILRCARSDQPRPLCAGCARCGETR